MLYEIRRGNDVIMAIFAIMTIFVVTKFDAGGGAETSFSVTVALWNFII